MSEILPRHYLVAILVFSLVITGGVVMFGELRAANPSYGDGDDLAQFNDTFSVLDEAVSKTDSLESSLTNLDTNPGVLGFLDALVGGSWNTLKLLGTSFSFMDNVFKGLTTFFGVPAWIPLVIMAIITVILVFALFSAVFQRDV